MPLEFPPAAWPGQRRAHKYALLEFSDNCARGHFFGLRAAQQASCPMTAAGKRFLSATNKHIRVSPHIAWDEHWLAQAAVNFRNLWVPRRQGPRGAFAVHAQPAGLSVHHMRFEFADVVTDVVDDVELQVFGRCCNTCSKVSRTQWVMSCRLAKAKFAALYMAPI